MGGIASIIGGGLGLASTALGLFGGEKESSPSTSTTRLLYPRQEELLDTLLEFFEGQFGRGVKPYPGKRVAGMSPMEQMLSKRITGFLEGPHPTRDLMANHFEDVMDEFDPEATMDWWEGAVKTPALRSWQQDVVPDIMEEFAGLDALDSGASRRAISESGADVMANIDAILADTMFGERRAHEARQNEILPFMMGFEEQPLDWYRSAAPFAGLEREIEQQHLTADYQDWLMQQPYANPWLETLLPYVMATYKQAFAQPGAREPNMFSRMAHAIPGLAGGIGGIVSGIGGLGSGGGGFTSPMNSWGLMSNMPW